MNDEDIKKALEEFQNRILNTNLSFHIFESEREALKEALALFNRQQERIEELEIITGLANSRKYYRKFVDEIFCKQEGNELSEPDFDYIYQLYFEQQAEIERLENAIIALMSYLDISGADKTDTSFIKQATEFNKQKRADIKAEAIKEFAERLKEMDGYNNHTFDDCASIFISEEYRKGRDEKIKEIWNTIDCLKKEMEGGENDTN